jgi:DNA-binding beta-propeller fold protein YncE
MTTKHLVGGAVQGKRLPKYLHGFIPNVVTFAKSRLRTPKGITTDGQSLYISDDTAHAVFRVGIDSDDIDILAGSGELGPADGDGSQAQFRYPHQLTTDGSFLYVCDSGNATIRRVSIHTQEVITIAGKAQERGYKDGVGSDARFMEPTGITIFGDYLYVSDGYLYHIRRICLRTYQVVTFAGGNSSTTAGNTGDVDGTGTQARFNGPGQLTTDGEKLYVCDMNNNAIKSIDLQTGKHRGVRATHFIKSEKSFE